MERFLKSLLVFLAMVILIAGCDDKGPFEGELRLKYNPVSTISDGVASGMGYILWIENGNPTAINLSTSDMESATWQGIYFIFLYKGKEYNVKSGISGTVLPNLPQKKVRDHDDRSKINAFMLGPKYRYKLEGTISGKNILVRRIEYINPPPQKGEPKN